MFKVLSCTHSESVSTEHWIKCKDCECYSLQMQFVLMGYDTGHWIK